MKKYLLFVLLLTVSAASFRAAQAVECANSSEDRSIDYGTGEMVFYDKCTSIEAGSHAYYGGVKSLKFPDGLESIGDRAFKGIGVLTSIDLSNTSSLSSIGNGAFDDIADGSTVTVKKGSKAHALLGGSKGTDSKTGDPIDPKYGNKSTLIVLEPPTPVPGTVSGAAEVIRVVPLPEDEFGSYELDPLTGEKVYLVFHTYAICMDFLNNEELCSGYERCYHK